MNQIIDILYKYQYHSIVFDLKYILDINPSFMWIITGVTLPYWVMTL